MSLDENVLLADLVNDFALELARMRADGEGDHLPRQVAIGTFLVRLAVARTQSAQGWVRLSGEMGREKMLETLAKIQGRPIALPELSAGKDA